MELFTNRGQVDLYDGFNWAINYTTADVIDLSKRKASYTKTIRVPYTAKNSLIFQGLNQDNSDNTGYDARQSLGCFLQHNGKILIEGVIILLSWGVTKESQEIELQILQRTKTLISDLKGVTLNELDFNNLNHTYTLANVLASYDGFNVVNGTLQAYQGYVYPLVDYGKDDNFPTQWDLIDLRPSLYLREIVDRIFLSAGKTYTSDFFNSPYWLNLILINTIDKVKYTDAQLVPFDTDLDYNTTWYTKGLPAGVPIPSVPLNPWWNTVIPGGFSRTIPFDNVITDVNAQWDITNPLDPFMTVQRTGTYKIVFSMAYNMETYVNLPEYLINFWYLFTLPHTEIVGEVTNHIDIIKNGITYDFQEVRYTPINSLWATQQPPSTFIAYPNPAEFLTYELELDLVVGDVIRIQQHMLPYDESGLPRWLNSRFVTTFNEIKTELVEAFVLPGDEINFLNYIPNIKAEDFINTLFNTFNLWAIDDPYNQDNLIIEPRTNFFNLGGYVDWSQKYDVSRLKKFQYLAESLPKRFLYNFANSEDVEIKKFLDLNGVGYGDYISEVDINFTSTDQVIKTSLTPIKATLTNNLIYPLLYKQDNDLAPKESLGNLFKIAFVKELQGFYGVKENALVTTLDRYIYAGEFDDPLSPTHSLTFGVPDTSLLQSQAPYWNLWRLFHEQTENEQTKKGAKVVELYVYLNENDINQLDIRRVVFINNVFYRIVQIVNYNPLSNKPTQVKLLQIEAVQYDFTSNEIIYKTFDAEQRLISTNKNEPFISNINRNLTNN